MELKKVPSKSRPDAAPRSRAQAKSKPSRRARGKSKLIWADKVALLVALLILALSVAFWVEAVITTGEGNTDFLVESLVRSARYIALIAVPVWIALRIVDFLTGGPARRKASGAEPPDEIHPKSS